MNDYIQPSFYRFNEDSLKLVKWLASRKPQCTNLLDLGAGCGVIGIELSNYLLPAKLTLLEGQKEFIPYLENNISTQLKAEPDIEIVESTFGQWNPPSQYDLIVCNPPYYLKGHGQEASDPAKNMARSFVVDDWRVLLKLIEKALAKTGRAFMVVKNDHRILKEVEKSSDLELIIHQQDELVFLELSRLDID